MPTEGSDSARARRFARGPSHETLLQLVERIGDAYGLVLVLILTTFVVAMTLPPEGWGGRLVAVAVAGLTAIMALTSSDVRPGRVRLAIGAALAAILAAALARALSSDALLGIAFIVNALLLAVAATTILRRVVLTAQVDFRTILGAISVFTLLGLLFGFLFFALGRLVAGDVFSGVAHAQARDYLFFSYTTLTTTGYGNLVPAGDGHKGAIRQAPRGRGGLGEASAARSSEVQVGNIRLPVDLRAPANRPDQYAPTS